MAAAECRSGPSVDAVLLRTIFRTDDGHVIRQLVFGAQAWNGSEQWPSSAGVISIW